MTMLQTPDNFQYARSAIRDIFYQMPTRTVLVDLWPRYLSQISETLGDTETLLAVADLRKKGYLTFGDDVIKWKDPITTAITENFKYEYGCLMLDLDIEDWDRMLAMIDTDDIYDTPAHGLEYHPHVTILFGFLPDVKEEAIKEEISKLKISEPITLTVTGISHFSGTDCDPVKFDVVSPYLNRLHEYFKKFPHVEDFPEYRPHITIAYVKRGKGAKYDHVFRHGMVLKSKTFHFSDKDKNSLVITV